MAVDMRHSCSLALISCFPLLNSIPTMHTTEENLSADLEITIQAVYLNVHVHVHVRHWTGLTRSIAYCRIVILGLELDSECDDFASNRSHTRTRAHHHAPDSMLPERAIHGKKSTPTIEVATTSCSPEPIAASTSMHHTPSA
jgi:hypothetical protein